MLVIQLVSILSVFFLSKMYHRQSALSHVDELYAVFSSVSIGTVVSIAVIAFFYRDIDYPRLMMVYAWVLTIICVAIGRMVFSRVRWGLQSCHIGQDRVLLVGTGELGQLIHHKMLESNDLGYNVIGYIESGGNGNGTEKKRWLPPYWARRSWVRSMICTMSWAATTSTRSSSPCPRPASASS